MVTPAWRPRWRRKRAAPSSSRFFRIKPFAEIFVGGVDPELVGRWAGTPQQTMMEGQGQSEIILDESDAILVGLAGKREVSDGAGLGGP